MCYYWLMTKFTRSSLVALVGATLFVAATPLAASAHPVKSPTSLYDCSTVVQRPSQITITCADGNRLVKGIVWSSWSGKSAKAKGTLEWNTCTPTCVASKVKTRVISFTATDRKDVKGTWLYTELKGPKGAWGTKSKVFDLPTSAL